MEGGAEVRLPETVVKETGWRGSLEVKDVGHRS